MKKAVNKSKEAAKRAAYIVGHLQGVQRMIDQGRYCIDVVKQIDAVEGSLKKLREVMMENHLKGCVLKTMKGGDKKARSRAVRELLEAYKKR